MHLAASFVLLLGKLLRHRVASLLVTKNQAVSTSLIVLTRFLVTKFELLLKACFVSFLNRGGAIINEARGLNLRVSLVF